MEQIFSCSQLIMPGELNREGRRQYNLLRREVLVKRFHAIFMAQYDLVLKRFMDRDKISERWANRRINRDILMQDCTRIFTGKYPYKPQDKSIYESIIDLWRQRFGNMITAIGSHKRRGLMSAS